MTSEQLIHFLEKNGITVNQTKKASTIGNLKYKVRVRPIFEEYVQVELQARCNGSDIYTNARAWHRDELNRERLLVKADIAKQFADTFVPMIRQTTMTADDIPAWFMHSNQSILIQVSMTRLKVNKLVDTV